MFVRIKVRFRNILGSYTWLSGLRLGLEIILGVIHMVVRIKVRFRNILRVIHMVGGLN